MYTWGRIVAARARLVLAGGLVLVAVAAAFGLGVFDSLSDGGFDDPASESSRALEAERETFGSRSGNAEAEGTSSTCWRRGWPRRRRARGRWPASPPRR